MGQINVTGLDDEFVELVESIAKAECTSAANLCRRFILEGLAVYTTRRNYQLWKQLKPTIEKGLIQEDFK